MAEREHTGRGFSLWKITNQDYRGEEEYVVTVQESSLATERKVWVGRSGEERRMHLTEDAARELRDALDEWLEDGEQEEAWRAERQAEYDNDWGDPLNVPSYGE